MESGSAIDFWALRRAVVLLIVRRWRGITSASSEEGRESISDKGISSASSSSPSSSERESSGAAWRLLLLVDCRLGLWPPRLLSLELSLSSIREVSI